MHVGFFSGDITRSGGTENVSIMLANTLSAGTDYTISFISLFEEHDSPFFPIDSNIQRFSLYPTVTHGIQHYFDTCKRLRNIVVKQHIDVVIDIDGILDMYSLPLKRKTGVKVVSWEHFNYLQNPDVPYRKLTRRWAARSADAIVTLTETDKKLYETNLTLRCPVIAIPNPMQAPEGPVSYDVDSKLILADWHTRKASTCWSTSPPKCCRTIRTGNGRFLEKAKTDRRSSRRFMMLIWTAG